MFLFLIVFILIDNLYKIYKKNNLIIIHVTNFYSMQIYSKLFSRLIKSIRNNIDKVDKKFQIVSTLL